MKAPVGIVGVLHGIVGAEREAGGAPEGVGGAGDEDAVLGLGDEVEGVVGEEVGRDAVNDGGDLPPETVVCAMDWLSHLYR